MNYWYYLPYLLFDVIEIVYKLYHKSADISLIRNEITMGLYHHIVVKNKLIKYTSPFSNVSESARRDEAIFIIEMYYETGVVIWRWRHINLLIIWISYINSSHTIEFDIYRSSRNGINNRLYWELWCDSFRQSSKCNFSLS